MGRDHFPSRVLALATAPAAVFNSSWAPCNPTCVHLSPWNRAPPANPGQAHKRVGGSHSKLSQSAPRALADFSLVNERGCKISPEQMFRRPGSSGEKGPSFPAASSLRFRRSLAPACRASPRGPMTSSPACLPLRFELPNHIFFKN